MDQDYNREETSGTFKGRPIVLVNGRWINAKYVRLQVRTDPPMGLAELVERKFARTEDQEISARVLLVQDEGHAQILEPDLIEWSERPSGRVVLGLIVDFTNHQVITDEDISRAERRARARATRQRRAHARAQISQFRQRAN